jgi:hypothetical protein
MTAPVPRPRKTPRGPPSPPHQHPEEAATDRAGADHVLSALPDGEVALRLPRDDRRAADEEASVGVPPPQRAQGLLIQALELAEEKVPEDGRPLEDTVVALASRRRKPPSRAAL